MDAIMKRFLLVFTLILSGVCIMAHSEEFVVKKKKKKQPSLAALKEDCCRASGDLMAAIPGVLTTIADIQVQCLTTVCGVLESDAESFCERASKQELTTYLDTLEKMYTQLQALQHELEQGAARLRTQSIKR